MVQIFAQRGDDIVSILDARHEVNASGYHCPGCGDDMIAIRGAVRRPHFRHVRDDADRGCNRETYLHAAAKKRIAKAISGARSTGSAYLLKVPAEISCAKRQQVLGGRCRHATRVVEIDLTAFETVTMEAERGRYRFDILLESDGACLALEVAVTHPIERDKQSLGHPVVEISLSDEESLLALSDGIDAKEVSLATWGIEPAIEGCAGQECASRCLVFEVYRGGSTRVSEVHPWVACPHGGSVVHREVFGGAEALALPRLEALDRLTRRAYFELHQPVRSCLLCRHHSLTGNLDGKGPVWCAAHRKSGSVNMAPKCYAFTPFATADEIREIRLRDKDGSVVDTPSLGR